MYNLYLISITFSLQSIYSIEFEGTFHKFPLNTLVWTLLNQISSLSHPVKEMQRSERESVDKDLCSPTSWLRFQEPIVGGIPVNRRLESFSLVTDECVLMSKEDQLLSIFTLLSDCEKLKMYVLHGNYSIRFEEYFKSTNTQCSQTIKTFTFKSLQFLFLRGAHKHRWYLKQFPRSMFNSSFQNPYVEDHVHQITMSTTLKSLQILHLQHP